MNKGLEKEQEIVEAAKKDPSRFVQLYDSYMEQIYRYVYRRVNDVATAEDLVSQTFLDAMTHLEQYEFRGYPFSSWLYKIAHNNVLKWYRQQSKATKVDLEDVGELKGSMDIEEEFAISQDSDMVHQALKELEYQDAEIIRLKYLEEASNGEIAEIMGITANNVGVKLFRALKKLKSVLENNHR